MTIYLNYNSPNLKLRKKIHVYHKILLDSFLNVED